MSKRIESIDFVKGIAMIAITLGHILGDYGLLDSALCKWVYSFELPAFFIATGILNGLQTKKEVSFNSYVKKMIRKILYPYMMFSLVILCLDILLALRHGIHEFLHMLLRDGMYTITGIGLGALWFLPTFLIANIIVFSLSNISKLNKYVILSSLLAIGIILSYFVEKYSFLRDNKFEIMGYASWEIASQISKSIVAASLILIGICMTNLKIVRRNTPGGGYLCSDIIHHRHSYSLT